MGDFGGMQCKKTKRRDRVAWRTTQLYENFRNKYKKFTEQTRSVDGQQSGKIECDQTGGGPGNERSFMNRISRAIGMRARCCSGGGEGVKRKFKPITIVNGEWEKTTKLSVVPRYNCYVNRNSPFPLGTSCLVK